MKTTKQDFINFQRYAKEWQQQLGLLEWSLYFEHADIADVYARTSWSTNDMLATIQLARNWDDMRLKTDAEIRSLALHEILHVLMAPLVSQAEWRYASKDGVDSAEHSIVRRLENVLQ